MKEAVSIDGVSAKRGLWGRGSKKKHTSKQEKKHACLSLSVTVTKKQASKQTNKQQTNKQTKGLGANNYLPEGGPQAVMATTGHRNLSCTGGNSVTSPRNHPIVLGESYLCPHSEEKF